MGDDMQQRAQNRTPFDLCSTALFFLHPSQSNFFIHSDSTTVIQLEALRGAQR